MASLRMENSAQYKVHAVRETRLTWLAMFTTMGTLVCCALPITLVALGMGATMASLVSNVPFLVTLSQHTLLIFAISGSLLVAAGWQLYRPGRTCPTDPGLAELCRRTEKWNRRIFWFSILLWLVGFLAAFLALPLQVWLDGNEYFRGSVPGYSLFFVIRGQTAGCEQNGKQ